MSASNADGITTPTLLGLANSLSRFLLVTILNSSRIKIIFVRMLGSDGCTCLLEIVFRKFILVVGLSQIVLWNCTTTTKSFPTR